MHLHDDTSLSGVTFECLMVSVQRPWLNAAVFSDGGWELTGEPRSYISTGSVDDNPGVLPLLPAQLLIGTNTTVEGTFAASDVALVKNALSTGSAVSLGPFVIDQRSSSQFAVGDAADTPALYVAAVVSSLVPRSPQLPMPD